jgi:hypothetical protein
MSDRQFELATRRDALIARSAIQRQQLTIIARDIERRLAGLDRGIEVARSVVRKPAVIAAAIAVVAFVGPRRLVSLAGRSALFLTTGRRVMKMLQG